VNWQSLASKDVAVRREGNSWVSSFALLEGYQCNTPLMSYPLHLFKTVSILTRTEPYRFKLHIAAQTICSGFAKYARKEDSYGITA